MDYSPEAATGRSELRSATAASQGVRAVPVGAHSLGAAVGVLLSLWQCAGIHPNTAVLSKARASGDQNQC